MKQAKLHSYRTTARYMYGYKVPRTYEECIQFDIQDGNDKWKEATALETEQLRDYNIFIDMGMYYDGKIPQGY